MGMVCGELYWCRLEGTIAVRQRMEIAAKMYRETIAVVEFDNGTWLCSFVCLKSFNRL